MKLLEALEIVKKGNLQKSEGTEFFLACGFTPLHLQTFLAAQLQLLLPQRRIELQTGLYGDLLGNISSLIKGTAEAAAVVIEWQDLDPRLGIRRLGGWGPAKLPEILENLRAQTERIRQAIEATTAKVSLAISLPTLPLPPLSSPPGWRASAFEFALRGCLDSLGAELAQDARVRVLNPQRLDALSSPSERLDVKSEVVNGFPYRLHHTSVLAELLARLIQNPQPRKGLVTDLDDTLWSGILGEVGLEGISWDLDHHSHIHGLYQQMLRTLAEEGVLIGVASKNDPALVNGALQKKNLILGRDQIFPVEAHWGPKSESLHRILKAWNVGAESVVFIDDSPLDLAEVKAAFPEIECVAFPKDDPQAAYQLFETLRDLFGKQTVSEEDSIRLESLRRASALREQNQGATHSTDSFLEQAGAHLTLNYKKLPPDPRALDLVNKTNQFNLNGRRFTDVSWLRYLNDPDSFTVLAAYEDKFGPLGKIAVLAGREEGRVLLIDIWVMSCRAFSRRIEHSLIDHLFDRFPCEEIAFEFAAMPRNGPIQDFFAGFLGQPLSPRLRLSRKLFMEKRPPLFIDVKEIGNG